MATDGHETIFTMEATPLKYGPGASEEVGWELKRLGMSRVMLVSDPGVVAAGITPHIQELIEAAGIKVEVWDGSGHFLHLADPSRMAARIAAFVATLA